MPSVADLRRRRVASTEERQYKTLEPLGFLYWRSSVLARWPRRGQQIGGCTLLVQFREFSAPRRLCAQALSSTVRPERLPNR